MRSVSQLVTPGHNSGGSRPKEPLDGALKETFWSSSQAVIVTWPEAAVSGYCPAVAGRKPASSWGSQRYNAIPSWVRWPPVDRGQERESQGGGLTGKGEL